MKKRKSIAKKSEETLKIQQGLGPSDGLVLIQNLVQKQSIAGAQFLSLGTWGETQASGRGAPSTQVWWNLGLSSVQHNQTNAANKRKNNNGNYIFECVGARLVFCWLNQTKATKKMSGPCRNVEWEEMLWMRWLTGEATPGSGRVHQHQQG